MLNNFKKTSIAYCNISLNNFLQIFISFITNSEKRTNISTYRLIFLDNVNMNNIIFKELPCKSQMISPFGRWSEIELTIIFFIQIIYYSLRIDICKLLMIYFTISYRIFLLQIRLFFSLLEIVVDQIIFWNILQII
jgi:hypothetical protein